MSLLKANFINLLVYKIMKKYAKRPLEEKIDILEKAVLNP
jgi:hypothetical protein